MAHTRLKVAILAFAAGLAAAVQAAPPLAFRIDEGSNINSFLRDGRVAAHLLLRSGHEPRILVAFPAGNSGVGLWFETAAEPVTWTIVAPPRAVTALDERRRELRGIEFEVDVRRAGAAVSRCRAFVDTRAARLRIADARHRPKSRLHRE